MNNRFNNTKTADKISGFIAGKAKILITILAVVIVGVSSFAIYSCVKNKQVEEGLESIAQISDELSLNYSTLSAEEKSKRCDEAISSLGKYTSKSGVVGVRANMLAAEISKEQKNEENAASFYEAAASKDKKAYTFGICCFNAANCYENIGNLDKACEFYKKAADAEVSLVKSHAMFSLGRVYETMGKTEEAVNAYTDLYNQMSEKVSDQWVMFAKSRLLSLGK